MVNKEEYTPSDMSFNEITSGHSFNPSRIINYPFAGFTVKVIVTDKGEFVGIKEIKENKRDFLSYKQKLELKRSDLADEFYRE